MFCLLTIEDPCRLSQTTLPKWNRSLSLADPRGWNSSGKHRHRMLWRLFPRAYQGCAPQHSATGANCEQQSSRKEERNNETVLKNACDLLHSLLPPTPQDTLVLLFHLRDNNSICSCPTLMTTRSHMVRSVCLKNMARRCIWVNRHKTTPHSSAFSQHKKPFVDGPRNS